MSEFQTHHLDFDNLPDVYVIKESIVTRRLYIKNMKVQQKILISGDVTIRSVEPILIENCSRVHIEADIDSLGMPRLQGGIHVAGDLKEGIDLRGLIIENAEHGLLMSQHFQCEVYGSCFIYNCLFLNIKKEGLYIGNSKQVSSSPLIPRVEIVECTFLNCNWDGCQIAKAEHVRIAGNCFMMCGLALEAYHDFDLTINPGCGLVYIERNKFTGKVQYLHSGRIFVS